MPLTQDEMRDLGIRIGRCFSPTAPIDEKDLFAGRRPQIREVIDAVNQRGQHAIVYGERGVGKTSLANVLYDYLAAVEASAPILAPRVNCEVGDTYTSLWKKVFERIVAVESVRGAGFAPETREHIFTLADNLPTTIGADDVMRLLERAGSDSIVIIIVDEFDRLSNGRISIQMADTIKMLSDHSARATLVLVGVADSVDELIHEHQSVERALAQIRMPRMSRAELGEIIDNGLDGVEMTISQEAKHRICHLSQGLPHFTHLLALHAGRAAIDSGRMEVELSDINAAIQQAIGGAQEWIQSSYHRATVSQQPESLFPQVLLACALARADALGFFAASDVRRPMSAIMRRPYDIPAFSRHLNRFCEEDRGPVLQKFGVSHRFRFRFVNPLMQPYVTMAGLASDLITTEAWEELTREGE